MVGGLLDLYLILAALRVRARQKRGDVHCPSYIPHPGYLLFLDFSVFGGLIGWGSINAWFGIAGEDDINTVYSFAILLTG